MEGNIKYRYRFFFSQRGKTMQWLFDNEFDYSNYTDSELQEIKAHSSLEQFAIEQLVEERERLFEKARAYDVMTGCNIIQVNQAVKAPGIVKYTRYTNLEDALRKMLYGKCKLGVPRFNKSVYIMNDLGVWSLYRVVKSEKKRIPEGIDIYSQEYMTILFKNKALYKIGLEWLYDRETKEDFYKTLDEKYLKAKEICDKEGYEDYEADYTEEDRKICRSAEEDQGLKKTKSTEIPS